MYNLQLQRGKVFFLFFWHDSTRRVDVKREVQNKHVMFLPFWFYILQYIWWINNKTQVSSFRLWTRCSLGVSTPVRWQTDCGLQTQTGRPTQCFLSEHRDKANWCFWDALWIFFLCVCVFWKEKCQLCCRNSSANIRFTNENDILKVKKVNWVVLLQCWVTTHSFVTIFFQWLSTRMIRYTVALSWWVWTRWGAAV